mmetsp:Transcript_114978/g.200023  ORF Transcript_114978/g.200023 Transcript_114978/m.200023 type:complete len:85 (+) Transcript_114978:903-1157(+)
MAWTLKHHFSICCTWKSHLYIITLEPFFTLTCVTIFSCTKLQIMCDHQRLSAGRVAMLPHCLTTLLYFRCYFICECWRVVQPPI